MQGKKVVNLGMMAVITVIIGFALTLSLVTGHASKITFSQDLADQISTGMTRPEVEAILGCPPGDYTTGPCDTPPVSRWTFVCDWWVSDTGEIGVWFDDQEKVKETVFQQLERTPQPLWQEILGRLRSLGSRSQTPRWNGKTTWPPKA